MGKKLLSFIIYAANMVERIDQPASSASLRYIIFFCVPECSEFQATSICNFKKKIMKALTCHNVVELVGFGGIWNESRLVA